MGKGDIKTRRGKLFSGSFGKRRLKKKIKNNVTATIPPKPKEIADKKPIPAEKTTQKEVKQEAKAPVKASGAEGTKATVQKSKPSEEKKSVTTEKPKQEKSTKKPDTQKKKTEE